MNVGIIQNGNNVQTGHKNNKNARARDMQIEQHVTNKHQRVNLSELFLCSFLFLFFCALWWYTVGAWNWIFVGAWNWMF
jgi:hypothetical protein